MVSPLELRDVVKHYPGAADPVRAVDGVSLSIAAGECVALYGPSGAGKTTLLLLIAGLLTADHGLILFEGEDVGCLSERDGSRYRRQEVGFVFQAFHLIASMSALDNATIKLAGDGLTVRDARRRARPWLGRVGLNERADQKPRELSAGECQRVAIARALVNEPRLLLADEPTGNLDSQRTREVFELLRDICHERQVPGLIATHDEGAMSIVDRAYTLCDGRLSEQRTPALGVGTL